MKFPPGLFRSNCTVLLVCTLASSARAQQCEQRLVVPGGTPNDNFGECVAFDGATAVFGALTAQGAAADTGAAWAFSGADFTDIEHLFAADGDVGDLFGDCLSVSGDVIVVGAPADSDVATLGGSAYIFERNGSDWLEVAKLTDPNAAAEDGYGSSVAVSGDVIVVGSPFDDDSGTRAGSVFAYERIAGVWTQTDQLTASDPSGEAYFGHSLALEGNRLIVGAPYADGVVDSAGAVYVFEGGPGAWAETEKLVALDGQGFDSFGESVSVSGDTIAVGARDDDVMGSAYVFERLPTGWVQADNLTPPDRDPNDQVGKCVSIDGDLLLVGAPAADAFYPGAGAAYLYARQGTTWTIATKLAASDVITPVRFAWSAAVSGETVIVGAPWGFAGPAQPDPGYLFEKGAFGWSVCGVPHGTPYCGPAVPNSSGQATSLTVHGVLEVDANVFSLLASDMPIGEFGYILTGRTPGLFTPPGSAGILCLSGSIGRFNRASEILQGPTDLLTVDLTALPLSPPQPAQVGETWNFQCWHRDGGTSNFSDGVRVVFR